MEEEQMEGEWQFAGSSKKGEPFAIRGGDVWGTGWQVSAGREAEAHVHDPVYGKEYIFRVFTIPDGDQTVEFAAGEFSPVTWGFYVRD